ncbi:MAG: sel1 repeat family protein [Flavobacteriales bacterium]|nr:sel1 repeat family protein [Flavobacteriales bacterium]
MKYTILLLFFLANIFCGDVISALFDEHHMMTRPEREYIDKRYLNALKSITPETITKIEEQAKEGDSLNQCILGILFTKGIGVPKNLTKATTWFERAGYQGDSEAQHRLGVFCEDGLVSRSGLNGWMIALGLWADPTSGSYWYEKAAKQGHVRAQYNIGLLYSGLPKVKSFEFLPTDLNKARFWLQQARDNGYEGAQKTLNKINEREKDKNNSEQERAKGEVRISIK